MTISALIPTYNRRVQVQRAIKSVLSQTVPVDEIIVVDDGSTDNTVAEIERQFGTCVRVIRQQNQGASSARRRAILESVGEWVAFLDSDDEWTPDRNRLLLEAIEQVPSDVAWIFGDSQEVTDDGDGKTQYEKLGLQVPVAVRIFNDSLRIQHPWQFGILSGSVFRRDAIMELGSFTENLKKGEDILMGFQIACRYRSAAIPSVVAKFYRTSDLCATSLSADQSVSADYYEALMKSYSLVVDTGRRKPWGELYADAVRGMCKVHFSQRKSCRRLSLQQFRYEVSCKSVLFFCAALLGTAGLSLWSKASSLSQVVPERLRRTVASNSKETATLASSARSRLR
jgi:glycosyltransferase involved in cell wall biosynthesis